MSETPYNLLLAIDTDNPTDESVMAFLNSQYQVLIHQTPLKDLEVDPTPLGLAPQYEPQLGRKIVPPQLYWIPELSLVKWRRALAYIKPVNGEPLPVVIQNRMSFRQIMMISLVEYVEPVTGLNVVTFNEEIEATMQMYDCWAKGLRRKNNEAQARHRAALKETQDLSTLTEVEKARLRVRYAYAEYTQVLKNRKIAIEQLKEQFETEVQQKYSAWQASKNLVLELEKVK